jgi:hypothetical protein
LADLSPVAFFTQHRPESIRYILCSRAPV